MNKMAFKFKYGLIGMTRKMGKAKKESIWSREKHSLRIILISFSCSLAISYLISTFIVFPIGSFLFGKIGWLMKLGFIIFFTIVFTVMFIVAKTYHLILQNTFGNLKKE